MKENSDLIIHIPSYVIVGMLTLYVKYQGVLRGVVDIPPNLATLVSFVAGSPASALFHFTSLSPLSCNNPHRSACCYQWLSEAIILQTRYDQN